MNFENIRKIPYNPEAEKAVIGGMFLKQDVVEDVTAILSPEDFFNAELKKIYSSVLQLHSNDKPIDPIIVLEEDKTIKEETFYEVIESIPTAANITEYAEIVKNKSKLRNLQKTATRIIEMTSDDMTLPNEIIDKAEALIFDISKKNKTKDVLPIREILGEEYLKLKEAHNTKGGYTGISSGYPSLDKMTSGFNPADLIIIAARPSMGKTAFALNTALNAAKEGKSILIFSLEMSKSQILQRLLAIESGIGIQKFRNGFMKDEDWKKLGEIVTTLGNFQINIADIPDITVMEIRAAARRMKAGGKLDMIVIDYLQLIKGSNPKSENRQQEISEISRSLKGLARELNIPVIALSQLSRATEQRADRRPMLSDLRDSGAIEQDADVVAFLYREGYYNEKKDIADEATEIIIGKQRNGPVGTVKLTFISELAKFIDV